MKDVRVRYFDALHEAAAAINSALDLGEVLATIVRATAEVSRVKGCSLMLLDDDKKHLVHTASYGLSDEYLQKGAIMADRSLADALKGEPVVVSDVANDARLQYPAEAIREGIGAMLCTPLKARDRLIGVIRIYSSRKGDFSESVIELLTAIANLSVIAIQNARMYDSLKKAYQVCQRELWHLQP